MDYTSSEKIIHSVVQISTLDNNLNTTGLATGFILAFMESDTSSVPVLVTNRHVLEDASYVNVVFTTAKSDGSPDIGRTVSATIDASNSIMHPDETVDLAVLPIAAALSSLIDSGNRPFYAYLKTELIPSADEWNRMDAVERVIMAGYPKGIRDTVNNLPIVRRGITATPPKYDFMGTPEFLVDMPCFEGCSGSPVFLLDESVHVSNHDGGVTIDSPRVFLLGIQHAIPLAQATGTLEVLPSDAQVDVKPVVPLYLNIGYIIKSSALLDFDPILRSLAGG